MQWPSDLHNAVAAVAPIDGVLIGAEDDRSTWTVLFKPEATDEQKSLAASILASFIPYADIPTVTRRQCRLWLQQQHGKTKDDVEAAIAAIPDATAREAARIEWEDATVFHYDHPLMQALAPALDIDPATLPDAFRAAALL